MKNVIAVLALLLCAVDVQAQVKPYPGNPQSNNGSMLLDATNAVTVTGKTFKLGLPFSIPTVPDVAPIIQGAQIGLTAGQFTGGYYSDPLIGFFYNGCIVTGTITLPCNVTDPWAQGWAAESDYQHNVLPIGGAGNATGTATASTTTLVLHDTGQSLTTNEVADYVLYDVTAVGSSVIASNTATTITVSPAITGMASGDSYQILRRDAENRDEVVFNSGERWPGYQWNVDKGRSLATGVSHMLSNIISVPSDPSYGLEFVPDIALQSAGSGNSDLMTLKACCGGGPTLTLFRYNSLDPAFGMQGNSPIMTWQGNGNNGQYWVSANNGDRGDFEFYAYNNSGSLKEMLAWDAQAGSMLMPQLPASSSAATGTVCWTTGGALSVDTTLACLSSTGKVKKNVKPLDVGLPEVMALKPISYNLKDEFNPEHLGPMVGLIAEDVQKVDPRLVGLDANGDPRGVRYMQMTAVLVKAIQDQQHEIESLKQQRPCSWSNLSACIP